MPFVLFKAFLYKPLNICLKKPFGANLAPFEKTKTFETKSTPALTPPILKAASVLTSPFSIKSKRALIWSSTLRLLKSFIASSMSTPGYIFLAAVLASISSKALADSIIKV